MASFSNTRTNDMPKHEVTIRMGAAHWDLTDDLTNTTANFRSMKPETRNEVYGNFMGWVRRKYKKGNGKSQSR